MTFVNSELCDEIACIGTLRAGIHHVCDSHVHSVDGSLRLNAAALVRFGFYRGVHPKPRMPSALRAADITFEPTSPCLICSTAPFGSDFGPDATYAPEGQLWMRITDKHMCCTCVRRIKNAWARREHATVPQVARCEISPDEEAAVAIAMSPPPPKRAPDVDSVVVSAPKRVASDDDSSSSLAETSDDDAPVKSIKKRITATDI